MCEICDKTGDTASHPPHMIHCPAYRGTVHIAHCKACPYHRYESSVDWCRYRTREMKIKDLMKGAYRA